MTANFFRLIICIFILAIGNYQINLGVFNLKK